MQNTLMKYQMMVLYGEKKLEPVEYRVISKVEGPWWWRQIRYYIESEFMTFGSFDTLNEAQAAAYRMRSYG